MNPPPLRVVFAGTPEFAALHLQALLAPVLQDQLSVVGVYTQPDRPAGRGKKITPSPVKNLALSHNLQVYQPNTLRDSIAIAELQALAPDILVVVAYGLMLSQQVLTIPRYGCINVHASLLPRWRGAAPIERSILAGDQETGVSIMQMDEGLDTGAVHLYRATPIKEDDNSETVTQRLSELGCEALVTTLLSFRKCPGTPTPQNNQTSTYAAKLSKKDAAVLWSQSAQQIAYQIQAFYPRSPAYTFMGKERLMLLDARVHKSSSQAAAGTILSTSDQGLCVACGEGVLMISRVQVAGKKPVTIKELLNGKRERYSPEARFEPESKAP